MGIFFSPGKTPAEELAAIAKVSLDAQRILTKEAKRAEREGIKANGEAQELINSGRAYWYIERLLSARYLMAEQAFDRAAQFHAQASVLHDFATSLRVQSSSTDMLKAQLRVSSLFMRIGRMLPNSAELAQICKLFALSTHRMANIRSELGDNIKEGADDLYEEAGGDGERVTPQERAAERMKEYRLEAGIDVDLGTLPDVPPARGRSQSNPTPMGVSSSFSPAAPTQPRKK